jgi:MoxR-like ATPase
MHTNQPRPQQLRVDHRIRLERLHSWEESFHVFDEESAFAVEMALATGRPLLVRGEPGIGKSQLARAAAKELNRCLLTQVITATTEGQDLLWQYDPVARLSDAQFFAATTWETDPSSSESTQQTECSKEAETPYSSRKNKLARYKKKKMPRAARKALYRLDSTPTSEAKEEEGLPGPLHPKHYLSPGILWWALDKESARRQYEVCRSPLYHPGFDPNTLASSRQGFVLLLDEIDKADTALPNSLLEVLGNGSFQIPLLNQTIGRGPGSVHPLVIITTNEERDLPTAFVRRCLVLHLHLDEEEHLRRWWNRQAERSPLRYRTEQFHPERALIKWLVERAEVHFEQGLSRSVTERAAKLLLRDRQEARYRGTVQPGQAEYLDLLRAVEQMSAAEEHQSKEAYQLALLEKISPYALMKSPWEEG